MRKRPTTLQVLQVLNLRVMVPYSRVKGNCLWLNAAVCFIIPALPHQAHTTHHHSLALQLLQIHHHSLHSLTGRIGE